MPEPSRGLVPGTVELLILRTLAGEPLHGFAISRHLATRSQGVLELQDAALYQALHRMERQGLVTSEWRLSENSRRARFYALTAKGRRRLEKETVWWEGYVRAVAKVLDPAPEQEG